MLPVEPPYIKECFVNLHFYISHRKKQIRPQHYHDLFIQRFTQSLERFNLSMNIRKQQKPWSLLLQRKND